MKKPQILKIHSQIINIYRELILPIVTKYFDSEINPTQEKSGGKYATTLVSKADLLINDVLTEKLSTLFPDTSIISEESEDKVISKYTFIIDPIDGTHAFVRNLDDWGISIALCEDGEVIYSIIFFPNCKTEYYYAIKDLGAFDSNDKKVIAKNFFKFKPTLVSAPSSRKIGRALIDYTEGKMLSFRAYGSVVYSAYTLLRGGTDFIVFDDLNIWDILGCVFISKQAGLNIHWYGDEPKLDNTNDLKKVKYTLAIYKPDFDKELLKDFQNIINQKLT